MTLPKALLVILAFLHVAGCADSPPEDLAGTWQFRSADWRTDPGETFEIVFEHDDDDWFGAELRTNCGLDGILTDWTDIEVEVASSQSQNVGSLSFTCVHGVHAFGGHDASYFAANFVDDVMLAKRTYSEIRGNKQTGYYPSHRCASLFVAIKVK